jgi:C_GCAxxG_C_C family probable redox protein
MTSESTVAVQRFAEGLSCSQAVFSAFSERFGLPAETAMRVASAFGGGMARRGEVCGAVTGALMVLGLARGHASPGEADKERTYGLVNDFIERFRAQRPSMLCRDLILGPIDTPERLQTARDRGVFREICPGIVRDAADLVAAVLDANRLPR